MSETKQAESARAAAFMLGGGLLGLSLLSWVRVARSGSLALIETDIPDSDWIWLGLAFAGLWGTAAVGYALLWRTPANALARRRILTVAFVLHAIAATAAPLTSNDVFSYLAYGRLFLLGGDPYGGSPADLGRQDQFGALVHPGCFDWPSPYGPLGTLLHAVAASTGSVVLALITFKLMMLAAVWGAILIAARSAEGSEESRSRTLMLFAWNPLLAWETCGQMHNEGFLVFAVVGALAMLKRRPHLATACLTAGFTVKVLLAPVLGLWFVALARTRARSAVASSVVAAAVIGLVSVPFWHGWNTLYDFVAFLHHWPPRPTGSLAMVVASTLQWLPASVAFEGDQLWRIISRCAFALIAIALVWRTKSARDVPIASAAATLAAIALAMHWVLPWYALLVLPFVLVTSPVVQRSIALYTVAIPWIYTPDAIEARFGIVTALIHIVPLAIVLRQTFRSTRSGYGPRARSDCASVD